MRKYFFISLFISTHICYTQHSAGTFELTDTNVQRGATYTTWDIYFIYDQPVLHDSAYVEVNRIKDFLLKNKKIRVEIQVHMDTQPAELYGRDLSNKRVNTLIDYLVKSGIDETRLVGKPYGDMMPIVKKGEEIGFNKKGVSMGNRRVVIKIIP